MDERLEALRARLEAHLGSFPDAPGSVLEITPLAGGACQDNYRVVLGGSSGGSFALRSDAPRSLAGSLDRRAEYAVVQAAREAGVPTPGVRWLGRDLVREGGWAFLMDWVEGVAIGRKVLKNPELADARNALPGELARALARIHAITPQSAPGLFADLEMSADPVIATRFDPARREDSNDRSISALRLQIDGLKEAHPALELCLHWLDRHRPPATRVCLVHGDFRVGNFMVGPTGLAGVLDWEFAHWGSAAEDLAWISLRDWRFGQVDKPIGGLTDRAPFYAAYAAQTGRLVDRAEVHFWEVLGNAGWAAGAAGQSERYLGGQVKDFELVAIGRRAAEMEYEALRLIQRGP
jgi:aminoglycoside phosphotransferase (APT) family kinase protein